MGGSAPLPKPVQLMASVHAQRTWSLVLDLAREAAAGAQISSEAAPDSGGALTADPAQQMAEHAEQRPEADSGSGGDGALALNAMRQTAGVAQGRHFQSTGQEEAPIAPLPRTTLLRARARPQWGPEADMGGGSGDLVLNLEGLAFGAAEAPVLAAFLSAERGCKGLRMSGCMLTDAGLAALLIALSSCGGCPPGALDSTMW